MLFNFSFLTNQLRYFQSFSTLLCLRVPEPGIFGWDEIVLTIPAMESDPWNYHSYRNLDILRHKQSLDVNLNPESGRPSQNGL